MNKVTEQAVDALFDKLLGPPPERDQSMAMPVFARR